MPDAFVTTVLRQQRATLNYLLELTASLDTDAAGFLTTSKRNLEAIPRIIDTLQDSMVRGDYAEAVGAFVKQFNVQADFTDEYLRAVFKGEAIELPTANAILTTYKDAALREFLRDGLAYKFIEPLRDQITGSVVARGKYSDLVKTLRTSVLGDDTTDGKLIGYLRNASRDAFAITDRSYTVGASEDLGLKWFLYTGGMKKTTRAFCHARNGKFWHKSEVEGWAKLSDWDGRIPGTDTKTIFIYAGGYNCQHSILPVSEAIVPPEDLARIKV